MRAPTEAFAYRYTHYGEADVLKRHQFPLPAPGPGEVLVEVISTSINHMDAFLRNGKEDTWHDDPWPRSSGSDFAGIVRGCGAGVTRLRVGANVVGHTRTGAHASHIVVPADQLVLKHPAVAWEVAGGLFLAGATALETLDEVRVGASDIIVISAAAGGVGSIEAQVAKYRGARVIGTCGERNFDYLRQLGITPVKYGEGIVERIQRAAGGPVTAYIDNYGKDGSEIAGALGVRPERYRSSADRREVELRLLRDDPESVAHATTVLQRVVDLAGAGAFRLLVSGLYPIDDIVDAFEDLAKLHARGKIVLATHPVTRARTLRAREVFERMP
ncbi:NADP-dependent oxidoreductase [Microbacterium sp. M3]|uniref:NADP-dependent oxidoreductase n=1 Tax=Microbacterium arthrosphaerae TaxID=792652 RepID=A0ABU4H6Y8_9MICO|nr:MULTISPECIES: NADP-dependent oxidoreductase [Microbacterium]MDW4574492.1 NADP-dependent oxidoreductase [Microbacterium arthrosphaerae]MDW7608347.1 NADP-dependent oxidoreductase [Microbacterium sp. M3]